MQIRFVNQWQRELKEQQEVTKGGGQAEPRLMISCAACEGVCDKRQWGFILEKRVLRVGWGGQVKARYADGYLSHTRTEGGNT